MTEERLLALIEAHGADPAAWPEAEWRAAAPFLSDPSPALREALAAAAPLDRALAALERPAPPAGLVERILETAPRRGSGAMPVWRRRWFPLPVWPTGGALASLAAGLMIGFASAPAAASPEPGEAALYVALGLDGFGEALLEMEE